MVTQPDLPPSARDFEAYRLAKIERQSTRAVAKLLHVSQTRVCQIITRVAEYMVETTQAEDDAGRAQQLAVAKQVAAEQIGFCMDRALRCFERSCGEVKTVRLIETPAGTTRTTTTRENCGETRYLTTIARLAVIGSNLPTCTLPIAARRSVATIRAEVASDDAIAVGSAGRTTPDVGTVSTATVRTADPTKMPPASVAETKNPSKEACSVPVAEQPHPDPTPEQIAAASPAEIEFYNWVMRDRGTPERQISKPVQPAKRPVDRPVNQNQRPVDRPVNQPVHGQAKPR